MTFVISDISSRQLYAKGQYSVPSDTACYPAKLMHGHIENLLDKGVDTIFYPCMSYNFNEEKGDNHFNCPVVAYYPELLGLQRREAQTYPLSLPVSGPGRAQELSPKRSGKHCTSSIRTSPSKRSSAPPTRPMRPIRRSARDIKEKGAQMLAQARERGIKTIILSGRPYHVDPEINHGINQLITSLGLAVVSEDCVSDLVTPVRPDVLNQWTYHTRLYNAAKYVTEHDDCELVQLVSFGCGIDAITTDEVSAILARGGRLYTQLKIDEINNLGAVKIRIRSLIGAVKERDAQKETEKRA